MKSGKDILGGFGPDKDMRQAARATTGGEKSARDVRAYQAPQGPKGITREGVGLGGSNLGNSQKHTGASSSGSPGLRGDNHGCCGSQGRH